MIILLDDDLCPISADCETCQATRGLGIKISDAQLDEIIKDYSERYIKTIFSRITGRYSKIYKYPFPNTSKN